MYEGTKGTLILKKETEAYLFAEGEAPATKVEVSKQTADPVADASATRPADSPGRSVGQTATSATDRGLSYKNEIAEFCSSVRTGAPVRVGPRKAMRSAIAIFTANQSAEKHTRLDLPKPTLGLNSCGRNLG
jgi:predicted dehydrogenase